MDEITNTRDCNTISQCFTEKFQDVTRLIHFRFLENMEDHYPRFICMCLLSRIAERRCVYSRSYPHMNYLTYTHTRSDRKEVEKKSIQGQ